MVRQSCWYAWSGAAAHVGGTDPTGLPDLTAWQSRVADGESWRKRVPVDVDE